MLQHGYLRTAQTGVVVRLLRERAPVQAPEELPTVLLLGPLDYSCSLETLDVAGCPHPNKRRGSPEACTGSLPDPKEGALLQTHRCAASLIPYMGGDSCVGHSTGSDLEQDLTHATCRSRLIHHTLDPSSVTFFSA